MEYSNISVLVVDDYDIMRKVICKILKQIGFNNIFEAEDGTTALYILGVFPVGLIITDWNMPHMSGLELLQKIRANPALHEIPVLMVTAEGQEEYLIAAVRAGVDNYIVKPFTLETLREKIEAILKKRNASTNEGMVSSDT